MEKLTPCLTSLDMSKAPELKDADSVKEYCEKFAIDECKNFISTADQTISDCDITEAENQGIASIIDTMKLGYLTYCVNDSSGKMCPLTNLIIETAANGSKSPSVDEAKKVYIEDCMIDECNARLISLIDIVNELGTATNTKIESEYAPLLENYKNKKCEDIDNISSNSSSSSNTTNSSKDASKSGAETLKKFTVFSFVSLLAIYFTF
ncbi:hypothetical protein BCR36DRAFT_586516 [Piromyces finnis]|uniref:Uncharacterized protein n=1 Tax=Piromyces finnis TaxID=1754191 RepID=A0A1Y1V0F3_9FUNG|nr:hypothetical protein BCR36DRAFT_586516 [Piromyces finnis]|eukprot:ORX43820.1 hypothetical protein BCR36DRAFT_586516 [Piromyces finnis]